MHRLNQLLGCNLEWKLSIWYQYQSKLECTWENNFFCLLLNGLEKFFDFFADLEMSILFSIVATFDVNTFLSIVVIDIGLFHGLFDIIIIIIWISLWVTKLIIVFWVGFDLRAWYFDLLIGMLVFNLLCMLHFDKIWNSFLDI